MPGCVGTRVVEATELNSLADLTPRKKVNTQSESRMRRNPIGPDFIRGITPVKRDKSIKDNCLHSKFVFGSMQNDFFKLVVLWQTLTLTQRSTAE